ANHRDFKLVRLANKTTFHRDDLPWDMALAWTYKDLDHPITPFAGVIDQLSNDLLVATRASFESDIAGHANIVEGGISFNRGQTRDSRFENVRGRRGALRTSDDQTATNLEAFIEDQFTFGGGFTGIIGATAAHNTREVRRRYTNPT